MAVKIKLPNSMAPAGSRLWARRFVALVVVATLGVLALGGTIFGYYYVKYEHIVDDRMQKPLFANTAKIYAAPRQVRAGQRLSARYVAQQLREAGYSEDGAGAASPLGTYAVNAESITIHPGPQSYHAPENATISFDGGTVSQIVGAGGQQLASYELEPLLITGLSDQTRTKRRLVTYQDLPKYLVPAVTAIEDRRFFSHGGVDYIRLVGAMRNDVVRGRLGQGGSTLTMQLARGFFLSPEKHFKRKLIEIIITFQLEHRFSKQEIFQMYANQIPLGQQGSFAINGFGEAAEVYFGKDVSQLNMPECALLAGIIQSPSRLNPARHAARAIERRNLVLDAMAETGDISKAEAEEAKATRLKLAPPSAQQDEAPYFVDLVREQLSTKLGDSNWNQEGLRIYTSLDPELEAAATTAVEIGMKNVDAQVLKQHATGHGTTEEAGGQVTYPQVALVALDPHTGQVLALVGGRNYGQSQLNHAVANRPTGSIFKPFVYAAAFNSALAGTQLTDANGTSGVFTPATLLGDQQTSFDYGNGQSYTPRNFHGEYHDQVTARYALQQSLNNATIALGQMVGFDAVASLAREAGVKSARGTPSVAIGSYGATPLEMAGAYTVFANNGVKVEPWMLASVRTQNGDPLNEFPQTTRPVLDPRVAYLTTSMLENVINAGTGAKVRRLGFTAPAAGKTGTSRDAWFAGYTSNLLCIIWVGNDDYSDIKMQGADAAAPIWAEFMKRAVALPQYSDTRGFAAPSGVVEVRLDKQTNLLSDASCPESYSAAFLDGTQPTDTCDNANGDQRSIFQKIFGVGQSSSAAPQPQVQPGQPAQAARPVYQPVPQRPGSPVASGSPAQDATQPAAKKPGFFGRLFGQKPKQPETPKPQPETQPGSQDE
ncbi:MAG TPA: PBP1A family penicillin-binding protein [Acidobacteriaceae bacterium]